MRIPCPTAAMACFWGRLSGIRPSFPTPAPTAPDVVRMTLRPELCRSETSRTSRSIFPMLMRPVGYVMELVPTLTTIRFEPRRLPRSTSSVPLWAGAPAFCVCRPLLLHMGLIV